MYELLIALVTFWRKVWEQLEPQAVKYTADWVLTAARGFAPGFRRRYRKKIISEYGLFNVRGLGLINTYRLNLEQVFVELRTAPSSNPQQPSNDPIAAKELIGNRPIWNFLQVLGEATALAIIGPPGSGKTTLLHHVALTLACNRQRRYRNRSSLPVLLFLRDHADLLTNDNPPNLGLLVEKSIEDTFKLKPPPGWAERQLEHGRCLVLLDGLDEVAQRERRQKVSSWVDEQIKNYPRCRFMLTSRPHGYAEAPLQRAHVLGVQPFNADDVQKFVRSWYLANEIMASGGKINSAVRKRAATDANDLLTRLRRFPNLGALTVNPLLLTMVAMVHRYHGALPGSRIELYREICEVLLGRWRQVRGVRDSLTADQKRTVLQPLAAHMMERQLRDISTNDALAAIQSTLERVGVPHASESFLRDLQASSGLLLEREAGEWSFAHLTFQEYLTSTHWLTPETTVPNWKDLVEKSWWHETLRLYSAQGNATKVIQACLDTDTLSALELAADCLEEARELDQAVRAAAMESLVAHLESPDRGRRHLAAAVQLSRRLKSFNSIGEGRGIDLDYLTCAEYQLFLDELSEGQYHHPDHWTEYSFPSGAAREPVTGMRSEDVLAFCQWLTQRQGGTMNYRPPRPEEARDYPAKVETLAAWCNDNEEGMSLVGLAAPVERSLLEHLSRLSNSSLPPPMSLNVSRAFDRARDCGLALDRTRAFDRAHPRVRAFDRALGLGLALDRGRDLARTRAFDRALDRTRALARTRAFDRALGFAIGLTHDRDLILFLSIGLIHDLGYALALRGGPDLVRTLIDSTKLNDLQEARTLIQELERYSPVPLARTATLLLNFMTVAEAQSEMEAKQAWWKCWTHVTEHAYLGMGEFGNFGYHTRSWDLRWLLARQKIPTYHITIQAMLELHWWLQTLLARQAGELPAWEGIRLVREQTISD